MATEKHPVLSTGAATRASQPVLLLRNIKRPDAKAIRYPLQQFRLTIGRSASDDICLSEGSAVSRRHASVLALDGEVVIEDLGSRNGTYVNRKLIRGSRQTTLKFGDVIAIGRYRLKLLDEAEHARNTGERDVRSLLQAWPAVPVTVHARHCALCQTPQADPERGDPVIAASDQDTGEFEGAGLFVDAPARHGRVYGRKLPRLRSPRATRSPLSKRAGLVAAKRIAVRAAAQYQA